MTFDFDFDRQQTRDAFRLGIQSAVAAVTCFLALEAIGSAEKFVGVLSAVLIVQPSVGKTVSAGWERFLATLLGSAIGLLCLFLLPNAYSVIVALAVVMFVMNVIAGFRPDWRYGVVAAVALALADTSGDINVAQARATAIGVGIVVGIAVSLIVWPESAAKRAIRYRDQALRAAAERFKWALQDEKDESEADEARRNFHDAMSSGRSLSQATNGEHRDSLNKTLSSIEKLYNSIVLINRVDSPLSRFKDEVMSREELITSGRRAIFSLRDDETSSEELIETFKLAVDKVSESSPDWDLSNSEAKYAASIVFALNEMVETLKSALKVKQEGSDLALSALKEALPR